MSRLSKFLLCGAPVAIVAGLFVSIAQAQNLPKFVFPVECELGEDCFIFKYVDTDPGDPFQDYYCGMRTSPAHKGTDFALMDPILGDRKVKVLASDEGTVVGLRDGLPDNASGFVSFPDGQNCGNGVRIQHAGGWFTQYCHMKKGSLTVKPGAQVDRGRVLGLVGSSGESERPHLHFQIERGGTIVDPFTARPNTAENNCDSGRIDPAGSSLWADKVQDRLTTYRPFAIEYVGLATKVPALEGILRREYGTTGKKDAPALVIYSTVLGATAGTTLSMKILGPKGSIFFEYEKPYERGYARWFKYAGKKTKGAPLQPGTWTAEVTVTGNGPPGPWSETATADFEVR